MGRVVFTRAEPRGSEGDRLRSYVMEVDGVPRGRMRRHEPLELDLAPGHHIVRAVIDWTGSRPLDIHVPETGELCLIVEPHVTLLGFWRNLFSREAWLSIRVDRSAER